jgi:hypothetical protein
MNLKESFTTLLTIVKDSSLVVNAHFVSEENQISHFELELFSQTNGFISLRFRICLNQAILAEKVNQNGGVVIPDTEIQDITEFIIRRNIELLPYLKEYNKDATNYDKLTELYYFTRGSIVGKRFGF